VVNITDRQEHGRLIVFEGTDGTGKSTQLNLLGRFLQAKGYPVIVTKEPTEGPYGRKIRELYVHRKKYTREEELELFLADRREHVTHLLRPGLAAGKIILCDRYIFSTAAYQGALGLDPDAILLQNAFAPEPDLVLLFEAPLDVGLERITSGRGEALNNFEQRDFLEKVAAIFSTISRPYIHKIDASGSIEAVRQLVMQHVLALLHPPFPPPLV
jgi:dTMP kinase